jgi:hypothetical protein
MKTPISIALLLLVSLFASADEYPFKAGTNEPNSADGLSLTVLTPSTHVQAIDKPVIKVVFTNSSTRQITLLNHFAFTASGPALFVRDYAPSDPMRFQHVDFAKQVYCSRQKNRWIILGPSTAYIYESPISQSLPPGKHILRVHYCVEGPADIEIKQCRAQPDCPKEFWHGLLVSTPVEVTIDQESPTIGCPVPPKAGASGVQ